MRRLYSIVFFIVTLIPLHTLAQNPLAQEYEESKLKNDSNAEADYSVNRSTQPNEVNSEYLHQLKLKSKKLAIWGTVLFIGGVSTGVAWLAIDYHKRNDEYSDESETWGDMLLGTASVSALLGGVTCWIFSGVFKRRHHRLDKWNTVSVTPLFDHLFANNGFQLNISYQF